MTTEWRRPIEVAGLTTLMVPTVRRPAYGAVPDPERAAVIDVQLASLGWQVRDRQGPLGVRNVPSHEVCRGLMLRASCAKLYAVFASIERAVARPTKPAAGEIHR
jgi:hypothetical protein